MKKAKVRLLFLLIVILSTMAQVAQGEELPYWAKQWKDWAADQSDPVFKEWAGKICTPEAIKLGKDWEEFLGYNAVDIVAKDTRAPSIKPGLVITPQNVAQYEKELRELLPFGFDYHVDRLMGKGAFKDYNVTPLEMVIVPTHHCWNDRGYMEASKKYSNLCKLDDKGNLQGWVAGIPFPHPKTALEIVHNYDRLTIMGDNLNSMPLSFGYHGRDGKQERIEKIELHWQNYVGRIKVPPFPVIPGFEGILEKGSIVALYPYDLRGFAAVRTRFKDDNQEDSFITYVPSMRRIRRLAGSNTQDPLVGSDLTWEDWKAFWSKMAIHPAKYELLGEQVVLCVSYNPKQPVFEWKYGGYCQRYNWERRPVWVVKISYLDPKYIYGTRIWYVDKENFILRDAIYYDQKGRLWKMFPIWWRYNPDNGESDYWGGYMIDVINKHISMLTHTVTLNMVDISENLFNLRYLSTKAH